MTRSDDPNDYVVHDPLLEKGKEKFNKMQAKQKRREREWAGKSLTWSHHLLTKSTHLWGLWIFSKWPNGSSKLVLSPLCLCKCNSTKWNSRRCFESNCSNILLMAHLNRDRVAEDTKIVSVVPFLERLKWVLNLLYFGLDGYGTNGGGAFQIVMEGVVL